MSWNPLDMQQNKLVWIDCETTGFTDLDKKAAYDHRLLELAVVVTDSNLVTLDSMNVVIHHDPKDYEHLLDDKVREMHTANGLFEECAASTISMEAAEASILAFLKRCGVEPWTARLCGNSVHLDRVYIEIYMPLLKRHLHYRNVDVSSLNEFLLMISPEFSYEKQSAHRAMGDIQASIAEAKYYREKIISKAYREA
ncbi:MAG: oligoribonuclease [Hafnia sp.]